jgi:hypothetical protein
MSFRRAVRRSLTFAAATTLAVFAGGPQPALAQVFSLNAPQYTFSGCNLHLCTTFTLFWENSELAGYSHPPGFPYAIGFAATHAYQDAGDGRGVLWTGSPGTYPLFGASSSGTFWSVDNTIIGVPCITTTFRNSGGCVDPLGQHMGWTPGANPPASNTTVQINYLVGPAGQTLSDPGVQPLITRESLTLTLVNVTATPEPATLALVAGGLVAIGAAARRRRT